jgi:hypothetical protein
MRKLIYLAAPSGFLGISLLWASFLPSATNHDAVREFMWGVEGTFFIFAPLHAGMWLEHRRRSARQLPALVLIVLMFAWLAFAIGHQYRFDRTEFPWELTVLLPAVTLFLLLFPLYVVAHFIAWILNRWLGIYYRLDLYDESGTALNG